MTLGRESGRVTYGWLTKAAGLWDHRAAFRVRSSTAANLDGATRFKVAGLPARCGRGSGKGAHMDIAVENHGSLYLLQPLNNRASDWLHAHVAEDAQWFVSALVVEPRYVADIVRGAIEDGLQVR